MKFTFHCQRTFIAGFLMLVLLGVNQPRARGAETVPVDTNTAAVVATNAPVAVTSTNDEEADAAWRLVRKAAQPPMPPIEWREHPPTQAEANKYYLPGILKAADEAKDFYTKYPTHPHAADAHNIEYNVLTIAANDLGDKTQAARLEALNAKRLSDPNTSDDEKLKARLHAFQPLFEGLPGTMDDLVKATHALIKDFPRYVEPHVVLKMVLDQSDGDSAKSLARELLDSPAPMDLKQRAQELFLQSEAIGKSMDLHFTAVDGRDVNLAVLKGHVVLVDFWATWCPPCMASIPEVKSVYDKFHTNGFDIIGISYDHEKPPLIKTIHEREMPWPQYFEGGNSNKYSVQFSVNLIPAMWLVDKQGNVRYINGRVGLADKVAKLLAEQQLADAMRSPSSDLAK